MYGLATVIRLTTNRTSPLSGDDSSSHSLSSTASIQSQPKLNHEQIFQLIDSALSFEACLYHQVLPLALEGDRVVLGMVNPEDTAAIEYVGRILSYMNYSLVAQPMAVQAHKALLSTYLNRSKETKPVKEKLRSPTAKTLGEKTAEVSPNDKPTFILVERKDLASLENDLPKAENPAPTPKAVSPSRDNGAIKQSQPQAAQALPDLQVQASHQSSSTTVLKTLPPKKLLQELLGRVLEKGIGRLYFEQKSPQRGRIICSQNGNLQCALPDVPVQVFQALINELKQLTHLPLEPVKEPVQAEIERFYQKERLLLRLRVIPGTQGEQATLQVLRGAALQFYQQQQITHQSRDALAIANQLQQKLNQLRERTKLKANFHSERYESLMALNKVLDSVEQQLEKLKNL
jgi:type II secretory ATPase GspE/PulE/Tfp pilus assembly ATPase PilB-like protein